MILRPPRRRTVMLLAATTVSACLAGPGCRNAQTPAASQPATKAAYPNDFSNLPQWDDGLSEMCYYNATDTIYGKTRRYFRVMLLNRQWLDRTQRVKTAPPASAGDTSVATSRPDQAEAIGVFKLNIVEEIPTENYNYRLMVTVFLNRASLRPEKLAASSQEWCGTTFKQLQWLPDALKVRGFSYLEGEADREWTLPAEPILYPREALGVLVRAAAASQTDIPLNLLPPMRSNHMPEPTPSESRLNVSAETRMVRVPFGRFQARKVTLTEADGGQTAQFFVEAAAPYRLLSAGFDSGLTLSLRFVERRAYWDRSKPSRFYRQGAAP
jgi:hypothetical protein